MIFYVCVVILGLFGVLVRDPYIMAFAAIMPLASIAVDIDASRRGK